MNRTVLMLSLVGVVSSASAAPRWLRLSWTGPTQSSITISWTDDSPGSGQAEVRPVGGAASATPATGTSTGASALGATYVAKVSGLSAATAYEYRVQSGGAWSAWNGFRTAPNAGGCSPVRLVAGGDSRGESLLGSYTPSAQWDDIALAMAAENPLAAFHTGDYVHEGSQTSQWAAELPRLDPLSRKVPFFLTLGNHDDGPGSGAGANFNKLFEYPADGTDAVDDYYSLVLGNVLVVVLSTHTYSIDTQLAWLRTVLEAHRFDVDWRVVFFHVPVWSSGSHGSNEADKPRAATLVPLLDEFGVDLVFNGHDHDYERFHPSRGGYGGVARVFTPLPLDNGKQGTAAGTIYTVTGGAGALVNPLFAQSVAGSASGSKRLHYLVLDAAGGSLTATVRDCGSQGFGSASCSGELEVIRLQKTAQCSAADAGTALDAGVVPDAGAADAGGAFDAGAADAGSSDAGAIDGGAGEDAGLADAGGADAGSSPGADGGPTVVTPAATGCGCMAGGAGALFGVLGLALALRRSRRAA